MIADDDPFKLFDRVTQGGGAQSGDNNVAKAAVPHVSTTDAAVTVVKETGELSSPATVDAEQLSGKFRRNTDLALETQAEIMRIPLDPDNPTYRSELAAKASVTNSQISAQIRTDETAVKSRTADRDYYTEIKEAMEAYRARERLKEDSKPPLVEYGKRGTDDDDGNH